MNITMILKTPMFVGIWGPPITMVIYARTVHWNCTAKQHDLTMGLSEYVLILLNGGFMIVL